MVKDLKFIEAHLASHKVITSKVLCHDLQY